MERAQLIARLLAELTTARAAISASYLRLWRPDERSLSEIDGLDHRVERRRGHDASPPAEEPPPRDAA